MRVLLVEDEPDLQDLYRELLDGAVAEIVSAKDTRSALELLENAHFDLLIIDILGRSLDGWEVIRQVKQVNEKAEIVVISGMEQHTLKKMSVDHGLSGLFLKPFESDCLVRFMERKKRDKSLIKKYENDVFSLKSRVRNLIQESIGANGYAKVCQFIQSEFGWKSVSLYRYQKKWNAGFDIVPVAGNAKPFEKLNSSPIFSQVLKKDDFVAFSDNDYQERGLLCDRNRYPRPESLVVKYFCPDSSILLLTCSGKKVGTRDDLFKDYVLLSEGLSLMGCIQ